MIILSGVVLALLQSPPALLSECIMARALCAMSDTTRQNVLTFSSLPDVRMRACLGILCPVSIPHLRGYRSSGPGGGLLVANATCFPSGPQPSRFFLFLVAIACGASLPHPPGIRELSCMVRARRRSLGRPGPFAAVP